MGIDSRVKHRPDGAPRDASTCQGAANNHHNGVVASSRSGALHTFQTAPDALDVYKRQLSSHGLSTTLAWALAPDQATYALEGNIAVTGAAVQWLGEFLSLIHI